ncbi:hypothetical protein GCM10010452_58060 [Crossiella cryophila]
MVCSGVRPQWIWGSVPGLITLLVLVSTGTVTLSGWGIAGPGRARFGGWGLAGQAVDAAVSCGVVAAGAHPPSTNADAQTSAAAHLIVLIAHLVSSTAPIVAE